MKVNLRINFVRSCCFLILFASFCTPLSLTAQNGSSIDETIELKAVPGLKYDKVRFVVAPGSTIRISLENADDQMAHNMLIVEPGSRERVVQQAEAMGVEGMENDYTPESSNVLNSISLLEPGEKASMIFNVPDEAGVYPYVCTYPAHGIVMYGAMYATNDPNELPPLDEDPNIPEPVRNEMAASMAMHPYPVQMPTVMRLFMPQSSPAAIAVGMEKKQSYNWDAGYSYLRYAWKGGYIDAADQWDAKAHEVAKIVGDIYYQNTTGFPFRIITKDSVPKPDFKGYRMIDGYPEFKYTMGDIKVRELILPADKTPGIQIKYNLENVKEPIWYVLSDNDRIQIKSSKGKIVDDIIKLTPNQAGEFTISIVSEQ